MNKLTSQIIEKRVAVEGYEGEFVYKFNVTQAKTVEDLQLNLDSFYKSMRAQNGDKGDALIPVSGHHEIAVMSITGTTAELQSIISANRDNLTSAGQWMKDYTPGKFHIHQSAAMKDMVCWIYNLPSMVAVQDTLKIRAKGTTYTLLHKDDFVTSDGGLVDMSSTRLQ